MIKKSFPSVVCALVLGSGAAIAAAQDVRPPPPPVTLHVGDPAPPISVAKWLKGSPVDLKEYQIAVTARNNAKILATCDKLLADWPFAVEDIVPAKYAALVNTDPDTARRFGTELLRRNHNAPLLLSAVASTIVDEDSPITGRRDYKFAIQLLRSASRCLGPDCDISATYAGALAKSGDIKGAVRYQSEAVEIERKSGYPQRYIDEALKILDEYRAPRPLSGARKDRLERELLRQNG